MHWRPRLLDGGTGDTGRIPPAVRGGQLFREVLASGAR